MKTSKILIAKKCPQSGELGYIFKALPFNPDLFMVSNDPLLIAHDLLEHPNGLKNIGTIHDELMALGGIYFIRGYDGRLRRDRIGSVYSFEENISSDIVRMFGELTFVDFKPYTKRTMSTVPDEKFKEVISLTRGELVKEYDKDIFKSVHDRGTNTNIYLKSALAYMRLGYRKTARRFNNDACYANNLFWEITDKLAPYFKYVDYEGQQLKLSVDGNKVYVDEYYEDY